MQAHDHATWHCTMAMGHKLQCRCCRAVIQHCQVEIDGYNDRPMIACAEVLMLNTPMSVKQVRGPSVLARQDLSCAYLAHHELASIIIITILIVITIITDLLCHVNKLLGDLCMLRVGYIQLEVQAAALRVECQPQAQPHHGLTLL